MGAAAGSAQAASAGLAPLGASPNPRHRASRRSPWLLVIPAAFLAFAFAWPMWTIGRLATLEAWEWAGGAYIRDRLGVALLQAILSVALTLAVAIPLALRHHRQRHRHERIHLALHALPFVLPAFVVVYGLQGILGAGGWTDRLAGLDGIARLGPLGAVVLAHAYYNYGLATRLLHAALERRPHRLEEAARTLGASPAEATWRTTIRLLLPPILAVALLVFVFTFSSFGVVLFLGGNEVDTLETLVYERLRVIHPHRDRAAVLGALQLGINLLLLGAYALLQRRLRRIPADRHDPPVASNKSQAVSWMLNAVALAPVAAVLVGAFQLEGSWSLDPFRSLADPDHPRHHLGFDLRHAILVTLGYAAASSVAALALTACLAYGAREPGPWSRLAHALAALPLGASSLLLGFGLLATFGANAWLDLRASPLAILLLHTLVAFPFAARVLLPALAAHDRRLDDAARALGASGPQVALRVHLPLLRAPLVAALGLAAAMSLGDFAGGLVLRRPATMSLSVWAAEGGLHFDPFIRAQTLAITALVAVLAAACYLAADRAGGPSA